MSEDDIRSERKAGGINDHIVVLRTSSTLETEELTELLEDELESTGVDINGVIELGSDEESEGLIRSLTPPITIEDRCPNHNLIAPCPYGDYP